MIRIQEATDQVVQKIAKVDRKDLSPHSRKLAKDAITQMKKIIQRAKNDLA